MIPSALEQRLALLAVVVDVEGHRGLRACLDGNEGAAARAVVRGLRILEAALRAVDVAHSRVDLRRRLGGEDLAQSLDVGELRLPRAHLLAQPRDELGPQDVDPAVQHAAPEGDLVLLLLELANHHAEVVVGQGREIGQWFHRSPFLVGSS